MASQAQRRREEARRSQEVEGLVWRPFRLEACAALVEPASAMVVAPGGGGRQVERGHARNGGELNNDARG